MDSVQKVSIFSPFTPSHDDVLRAVKGFPERNHHYNGMLDLDHNNLLVLKGRLPGRIELSEASLDRVTAALADAEIWSALKRARFSIKHDNAYAKLVAVNVVLNPSGTGTIREIYGSACDHLDGLIAEGLIKERYVASVERKGKPDVNGDAIFRRVARSIVGILPTEDEYDALYSIIVTDPAGEITLESRKAFLNETLPAKR
jgi:hypothetical protein